MHKQLLTLLLCTVALVASGKDNLAMENLIERILPGQTESFSLETIESADGEDVFELDSREGKVVIRGNSPLSQAVGLNWYLKYHCNTTVSWWADDAIVLPGTLPLVDEPVRQVSNSRYRFFLNYCTFGYTMPWWDWSDWERLIDWMALNGVNLPLAITGQEAVWQMVWREFGLSDEQIRGYFTGPAHLPWHRMANIDKWSGPLPQSYIDGQFDLQLKILERERQLGMKPVLPAFAGHVPGALMEAQPQANISQLNNWGGFSDPYRPFFLDPEDALFTEIQKRFLEKQTSVFGTDHYYGTDPFNEMKPPSWEPEYLAKVAETIYNSMTEVDSEAVWIQMAWLFYYQRKDWTPERLKAMLRAVPQDKMMLLDYYCEYTEVWRRTDAFYGQPYVWNYLGNFGGNTFMIGNLQTVEDRMTAAFASSEKGKLQGVGSTLEALDVNPLMYEFVLEKAWRAGAVDVVDWIRSYAARRQGKADTAVQAAWEKLLETVYTTPSRTLNGSIINARPALEGSSQRWTNPATVYSNTDLLDVWELMLKADRKDTPAYLHDLVNVASQALSNHAVVLRDRMSADYTAGDHDAFSQSSRAFLDAILDVDKLVATRSDRLLGKWIEDARAFGINEAEAAYYERNARNILTTWGEKGIWLNEYANRTWAGLTSGYYYKRWEMFIQDLDASLRDNGPFDAEAFHAKVTEFEWQWTQQSEKYTAQPAGDAFAIAEELYQEYHESIRQSSRDIGN